MKIRTLSLTALLFFGIISNVSALRVQSRAIKNLSISQTSYSESNPFKVRGKIWGTAPIGEVTRISYHVVDASNTTTWKFEEPLVRTFNGTEELNLPFEFDLSDVLVDENSKLIIALQKATMNGSFAQTLAQGAMKLVFPKKATEEKKVSRIEKFHSFADEKNIITQTNFSNFHADGLFFAKAQLLSTSGDIIEEKISAEKTVLSGKKMDFSILFNLPEMPGRYQTTVQIFHKKEAVTGIKEQPLIIKGEFTTISSLEVSPEEYFYEGDDVIVSFAGTSSLWEESLTLDITIADSSEEIIFEKELPIQTDSIGRFSGEVEFSIAKETAQLYISIEVRHRAKTIGSYKFSTQKSRKFHAAEGQTNISFAMERMTQDFMFSETRDQIAIIISLIILLGLIIGFIMFVHHIRHIKLLVLLLTFFVSTASAAVTSSSPTDGWAVNPNSADVNFQQAQFTGHVDLDMGPIFPISTDIHVDVKFLDNPSTSGGTVLATDSVVFQTLNEYDYDFVATVPSTINDGFVYMELDIPQSDIVPQNIGNLEIELSQLLLIDTTPPIVTFEYYRSTGGMTLAPGEFTNEPVDVQVFCQDATGCLPASSHTFEVTGNFCSTGEGFCLSGSDEFVLCDYVGNCSTAEPIEINQYDPVEPVLTEFDVVHDGMSAKSTIKAFESYIFSLVGLNDPAEKNITTDTSACGENDINSPFLDTGSACEEKFVMCAISPKKRGTMAYGTGTCEEECPPGTVLTGWGTCQEEITGCSFVDFPFCFNWILNGECRTFPFCFNWILGEDSACTPTTCAALGYVCGTPDDGCGTPLSCGSCGTGETCNVSGQCQNECINRDRAALIDFYNSTNGASWTNNSNWNTSNPIDTWHGVTVVDECVTGLNLVNNGLVGQIPASLGELSELTSLILLNNDLDGEIPSEVSNLSNLGRLSLQGNDLSGIIPASLGGISGLNMLFLGNNNFDANSCSIVQDFITNDVGGWGTDSDRYTPQQSFNYMEDCCTPTTCTALGYNCGTIDDGCGNTLNCGNCGGTCTNHECHCEGSASEIATLEEFYISTGGDNWTDNTNWNSAHPLDEWAGIMFGNPRACEGLRIILNNNNLIGTIPSSLVNLDRLKVLQLDSNNLNGEILSSWGEIDYLALSNNQLSGEIPNSLGSSNLRTILLSNNQLSGEIPGSLGNLDLVHLNLSNNQLSGEIPNSLGSSNLRTILLSNNQLSGEIPSSFGGFSQLELLMLNGNKFNATSCSVVADFISNDVGGWGSNSDRYTPQQSFNYMNDCP